MSKFIGQAEAEGRKLEWLEERLRTSQRVRVDSSIGGVEMIVHDGEGDDGLLLNGLAVNLSPLQARLLAAFLTLGADVHEKMKEGR